MNPELERLARKLERDGLRREALAVRAVAQAYRNLNLKDVVALLGAITDEANAVRRVAYADVLLRTFDTAAAHLATAPAELGVLLSNAVTAGVSGGAQLLALQARNPELFDAFRLRPTTEIEYSRHAAERLARYWGVEQDRLRREVQTALVEALERGQGRQQIAATLQERVNVSRSRANLIARNELGNAMSHGMRECQIAAGVTHYTWWSSGDSRVRPEHRARHGRVYAWDQAPGDGHPGQAIQCRCVALGVLRTLVS